MDLLTVTGHRPYPVADGPWIAWQAWDYLLFAHWRVPVEALHTRIPASLELDTYQGEAWIGVIPFQIGMAPRGLHNTGFRRSFNEINVRTYVTYQGRRPGILFFSLDASDPLSVVGARLFTNCLISTPTLKVLLKSKTTGCPITAAVGIRLCLPNSGRTTGRFPNRFMLFPEAWKPG